MDRGKILKMPSKYTALRNNKDELCVNCELTYRWLRFSDIYSDAQNRKVAFVDVMTTNIDGVDKKICGLAVCVDDLAKVINSIQQKE